MTQLSKAGRGAVGSSSSCDGKRLYRWIRTSRRSSQAKCDLGPELLKPIVMVLASMVGVQNHTKIGWL